MAVDQRITPQSARPVAGAPAGTRVDLDDLTKRYRLGGTTVTALAGVDLHVDEAALVVILGPSGSGKTTLLNLIGLLDEPTSGTIRLAGRDVTRASRKQRFELRRTTVSWSPRAGSPCWSTCGRSGAARAGRSARPSSSWPATTPER